MNAEDRSRKTEAGNGTVTLSGLKTLTGLVLSYVLDF